MVYVTQEKPGINFFPAKKYGDIAVLIPNSEKQIAFSCGAIVQKLKVKLSKFNDDDYLLLVGDPVAIGICTAAAASANNGRVTMLKWDRQNRDYYPVSIDLNEEGLQND